MQRSRVNVKLRPIGIFRDVIEHEVALETSDLRDLLRLLTQKYGKPLESLIRDPKTGELRSDLLIIVNRRPLCGNLILEKPELSDGDEVIMTYLVEGG